MVGAVQTKNSPITAVAKSRGLRWPWAYEQVDTGRDLRLDMLRGICFFVMTVNHISDFGPESWVNTATGHGDFFITAAEGFVFISGLVMGMVYCKLISKQGIWAAISKAFNRLVKIYWVTVGMTLFFVALATFTPLALWAKREWITIKNPVELVIGSFTLHFAFHGSSILIMFVLFLVFAPGALYLCYKGKPWIVLAISWGVWLANLFYSNQFTIPFQSNFPFPAWQTIFMTGLVIGYYRNQIINYFKPQLRVTYYVVVNVLAVLLLIFFILDKTGSIHQTFLSQFNYKPIMDAVNDKGNLPIERMLGIFLYLQAFYLWISWLWVPFSKFLGWFLIPIGEAGMYTFIMHLVLIIVVYNIPGFLTLPYFWYGIAQIASVGLLWIAVKTHFLYKIIPR